MEIPSAHGPVLIDHPPVGRAHAGRTAALFVAIVAAAVGLRAYALHLPGPNPDELLYAYSAERFRQGDPPAAVTVMVAGRPFPVGLDGYQGAVPVYVHTLVSGITTHPLRFRAINLAYAAAVIVTLGRLCWRLWGPPAGIYSTALLATMPAFVFYSRIGEMIILLRVALVCGALYGGYLWVVCGRWRGLYAASLLLGLGVSTRLETVWWIAGAGASLALVYQPLLRRMAASLRTHRVRAAVAVLWFALGAAPFVAYNVTTGFGTLSQIGQNLTTTRAGHSNLALARNVGVRVRHLMQMLDGGHLWGVPGSRPNRLMVVLYAAAASTLAARSLAARRRAAPARLDEFLLLATGALLVLSAFSPSTLNIGHLFILLPLPILVLVRFLTLPGIRRVAAVAVAVVAGGNLAIDLESHRALAVHRGRGYFSQAAYTLADDLRRLGVERVAACDWGLARYVYYFSGGRIKTTEIFGYQRDVPRGFPDDVDRALAGGTAYFLFYEARYSAFPREDAFVAHLARRGLPLRRHAISDTHGVVYVLYEVVRQPDEGG